MNRECVTAALLLLLLGTIEVFADVAEDLRACQDSTLEIELRLTACSRAAEAGEADQVDAIANELAIRAYDLMIAEGQYAVGIPDLSAAIALDPTDGRYLSGRGHIYLSLQEFTLAAADLSLAISLGQDGYREHSRLGLAYDYLDQSELALHHYSVALEKNPQSELTYDLRGDLYRSLGEYELAIADFTAALALVPSATTLHKRGWSYRRLGDFDSMLRDILAAYLLNPNLIHNDWLIDDLSLSTTTVFGRFVEEHWPARELPASDVLNSVAPAEGLRITYIRVTNDEQPVDPMIEAINDIIDWFVNVEVPLPIENTMLEHEITATAASRTQVTVTDLYEQSAIADTFELALAYATIPVSQSFAAGPPVRRDYGSVLDGMWPLTTGKSVTGRGNIFIDCPPDPPAAYIMAGCFGGVARVDVGAFNWTVTFAGWEEVLVPLGRRLTARLEYSEDATMEMLGESRTVASQTNWWLDPEIGWWVKREVIERQDGAEAGTVETMEAMAVDAPARN